MADSPGARHWLADATARTGRAERTMLAVAAEADARAEMSATDLSRLRLNLFESARDCRAALELMLDLHGASGFSVDNPLQRLWRDVAVGSRHPLLNGYLATENVRLRAHRRAAHRVSRTGDGSVTSVVADAVGQDPHPRCGRLRG
uniref:acyl-CoA dehydrogenase family protein n=1 Tax=Paractinoplanes polyasparticus TaxID=2856853 RepID=UPI001C85593C|nr:acyl-CoA dehydrogenase family protein [Actinoplanes polyasparticus]